MEGAAKVMEEALSCAARISDKYDKNLAFIRISLELAKQCRIEESISLAMGISDENLKFDALIGISSELAILGKIEAAAKAMGKVLYCAASIRSKYFGTNPFVRISLELANQGNWKKVEENTLNISNSRVRHICWKDIAKFQIKKYGWQKSLELIKHFQNEEAQLFYLKGWAEEVNLMYVNGICIQTALPILVDDSASIEELLRKYAINKVTFDNPSQQLIHRLNHTLNIQWIIDITLQFSKDSNEVYRNSSNLQDWVHAIADEDDRDQVLLWAKQVAKGKITEADFGEKIKAFI
jgi:hypothetical protein